MPNQQNEHNQEDKFELRSEPVKSLMSHVPNWLVRAGTSVIFFIMLGLILLSWTIKYPDIIRAKAYISTGIPPVRLFTTFSGQLDRIHTEDHQYVNKDDVLMVMRSNLSQEAQHFLKQEITILKELLASEQFESYQPKKTEFVFGSLQDNYAQLIDALTEYRIHLTDKNHQYNKKYLQEQIYHQKELLNLLRKQLNEGKNLKQAAENQWQVNKLLFSQGVISQADLYTREQEYQATLRERSLLEQSIISKRIVINDLEKDLFTLSTEFQRVKLGLTQRIKQNMNMLSNEISKWSQSYELKAPIDGTVVYLKNLSESQFIGAEEPIIAVVPEGIDFLAYLSVSKSRSGKIKTGQQVLIKLLNYPHEEYGRLEGAVEKVSLIADEETYQVIVRLPNGLTSSYNKDLNYSPEMEGQAEIITEHMRVSDRIFNQLKRGTK